MTQSSGATLNMSLLRHREIPNPLVGVQMLTPSSKASMLGKMMHLWAHRVQRSFMEQTVELYLNFSELHESHQRTSEATLS